MVEISPVSSNVFMINHEGIELEVYCSTNFISVREKSGAIVQYPEMCGAIECKDGIKFLNCVEDVE